jgi:hypothetical protein
MRRRLHRELRLLRAHALISTPALLVLAFAAFRQNAQPTRFTEIDVERINVVEPDGHLRMVISNRPRSIGPIYKGEPFGYPGGTRPGIIFFNDEGTENGGLTMSGTRQADGTYSASSIFTFDQFDQDQIAVLRYADENGRRRVGLSFLDRADVSIFQLVAERDSIMQMPDGPAKTAALERWSGPRNGVPLAAQRVFLGRDVERTAVLGLFDPDGRLRIRLRVDSLGMASLESLDEGGQVTARWPER